MTLTNPDGSDDRMVRALARSTGSARRRTVLTPTEQFFENLRASGGRCLRNKACGSVRFDIADGDRVNHWRVTADRGELRVSRDTTDADCVLYVDRDVFDGIVRGEVNGMSAMLRGAMHFDGGPEMLPMVRGMFADERLPRRDGSRR
jgi:hypothetical protein